MVPKGYEFVRQLGKGGFGVVHLARRRHDGRLVAVKLLHLPSDENLRRLWREAQVLHQEVANAHVVDLLDWSFDQTPPYLAMEFCVGESLRSWVTTRRPWRTVAEAMSQAASGLSGIHERGGFHRDIKPDNLLMASRLGEPLLIKVGDFGVARDPAVSTSGPMTRSAWGTQGYIAPELAVGAPFDSCCDIYSLGITAVELLTGGRLPSALDAQGQLPRGLCELLTAMTSLDPDRRPTLKRCQLTFRALLATPLPAAKPPAPEEGSGVGPILGFLALLAGGAALATMNSRDANGRFHGSDGRFRSGRWG